MLLAGSSVVSVVSVNTNNSVELPTLTYSTAVYSVLYLRRPAMGRTVLNPKEYYTSNVPIELNFTTRLTAQTDQYTKLSISAS